MRLAFLRSPSLENSLLAVLTFFNNCKNSSFNFFTGAGIYFVDLEADFRRYNIDREYSVFTDRCSRAILIELKNVAILIHLELQSICRLVSYRNFLFKRVCLVQYKIFDLMLFVISLPLVNGLKVTLQKLEFHSLDRFSCLLIKENDLNIDLDLFVLHRDDAVLDILAFYQLAVLNCKCDGFSNLVAVRCALLFQSVCAIRKACYRVYCSVRCPALNYLIDFLTCNINDSGYCQFSTLKFIAGSCIDLADLDVCLLQCILHCYDAVLGIFIFNQLTVLESELNALSYFVAFRCARLCQDIRTVHKICDLMMRAIRCPAVDCLCLTLLCYC